MKPVAGRQIDKPGLAEAQRLVWNVSFGRSDEPPVVLLVEGDELSCTSDVNGEPGFQCPPAGCRQGCTGSPYRVHVAFGAPWSSTTLAHEDQHAREIRDALATLLSSPMTFEGYAALADRNHSGPQWQPGGAVDKANQLLRENGL